MKKTIAVLTTLTTLALTVPAPAHAEEIEWALPTRTTVFYEDELTRDGDDVLMQYTGKLGRFVIVTNGTAPETDVCRSGTTMMPPSAISMIPCKPVPRSSPAPHSYRTMSVSCRNTMQMPSRTSV